MYHFNITLASGTITSFYNTPEYAAAFISRLLDPIVGPSRFVSAVIFIDGIDGTYGKRIAIN